MFNIHRALSSNRLMKSLTGLSIKEFNELQEPFEIAFTEAKGENSEDRQRQPGGGRKHTLANIVEKLFFILLYLKSYPLFDQIAFFFGVDRSQANRWVHEWLPLLEKVLGKEAVLPQRKIKNKDEFQKLFSESKVALIDGTERPIQRSTDYDVQKENYSGKKKRHTKKNLVVVDLERKVHILSETKNGSRHDYGIFKETDLGNQIPKDIVVAVDSGFEGILKDYPNLLVLIPDKKPKNGELTPQQKEDNKWISKIRVTVENTIASIKRYRSVTDIYRNKKNGFEDSLMLMACGLWNWHLKSEKGLLFQ